MSNNFFSIKYIAVLGLMLAILIVIGIISVFIKIDKVVLQFAQGLYVISCFMIPGFGMIFVGVAYGAIIDVINLSFITIPISIVINVLTFFVVKASKNKHLIHLLFLIACLLVFCYIPYQWFITWNSMNIETKYSLLSIELTIDSIQFVVSFLICEVLYFVLRKTSLNKKLVEHL